MENKFDKYGLSSTMGPKLRELVETQLSSELNALLDTSLEFDFDWSESCIEGHDAVFLDGSLENYSGIIVTNKQALIKASGWIEFIQEFYCKPKLVIHHLAHKFNSILWNMYTFTIGD